MSRENKRGSERRVPGFILPDAVRFTTAPPVINSGKPSPTSQRVWVRLFMRRDQETHKPEGHCKLALRAKPFTTKAK